MMRPLPPLALALVLAAAVSAEVQPTGKQTMDSLETMAGDGSSADLQFDGARRGGDMRDAVAGGKQGAGDRRPTPTLTTRKPKPTAIANTKAATEEKKEKPPFFDDETIGLTSLGAVAGGLIGFGLIGSMGFAGPLVGLVAGAVLFAAIWKLFKK